MQEKIFLEFPHKKTPCPNGVSSKTPLGLGVCLSELSEELTIIQRIVRMATKKQKKAIGQLTREQQKEISTLAKLIAEHDQSYWAIGDELVRLTERKENPYKVKQLAEVFGLRASYLSDIKQTAQEFTGDQRKPGVSFSHYRISRKIEAADLIPSGWDLNDVREEISKGRDKDGRPLTNLMTAKGHFGDLKALERQSEIANKNAVYLEAMQKSEEQTNAKFINMLNKCHFGRHEDISFDFPDKCFDVLVLDPPYANYDKVPSGEYVGSGKGVSCARTDCINATRAEAEKTTINALVEGKRVLKNGGTILLWQAAGRLNLTILSKIEELGFDYTIVDWFKNNGKVMDGESVWTPSKEVLFVIWRREDGKPKDHARELGKKDVIFFPPVRQRVETRLEHHMFEKPENLTEFLLRKHCVKGGIVGIFFGCSGSEAIACIKSEMNFIYIEGDKNNFDWGKERVVTAKRLKVEGNLPTLSDEELNKINSDGNAMFVGDTDAAA